ncbi:PH domain-containing protein [Halobaculum sp. MBLA0147]|uniref:PH domain-containing protein n=1 Tax=Halobaculum sp. MBLA0147 TaxID=3079934 RepID=UPI003525D7C0
MRRLHRYSAVLDALQGGVQVGSAGLFGGFFLANRADVLPGSTAAVLLGIAGFVVGAAYQVAYYYRFSYELTEEELIVASGVVGRQEREIPLERIQNVDVRRPAVKRALGLAVVAFETAGGSGTEATLDAVDSAEADRLQREVGPRARRLREAKGTAAGERERAASAEWRVAGSGGVGPAGAGGSGSSATGSGPDSARTADAETDGVDGVVGAADSAFAGDDGELLYEISDRELWVLSAVSFRPGAFAIPFVGVPFGGPDVTSEFLDVVGIDVGEGVQSLAATDLVTLALGGVGAVLSYLLAVWVVSAGLTYLQYYGFRLERAGDELRYERGLLGRYSGTIPLGKVQTVTVGENVAMRRLGYASLAVETAGYAPGGDGGGSETTVPLGGRDRVLSLAREVLAAGDDTGRFDDAAFSRDGVDTESESPRDGVDDEDVSSEVATSAGPVVDPTFTRPAERARSRYTRRYLIAVGLLAAVAGGVGATTSLPTWVGLLPLPLGLFAPAAARRKWVNRGYHETEWALTTRDGYWRRHTRIVPSFRLQTVVVTRTLFQRRWDLASVTADTASSASVLGGDAVVHDVPPERAEEIRVALLERLDDSLAQRRRRAGRRGRRGERTRAAETSETDPEETERETSETDPEETERETSETDPEETERETSETDPEETERETSETDPEVTGEDGRSSGVERVRANESNEAGTGEDGE